jgi:hypothetical protein
VSEELPAASLLRIVRVALVVDLVLVVANIATRFALGAEADLAVYDVFLAWNLPGHAVVIAMLVSILRSRGALGAVAGRMRIMLAAAAWTAVAASWIIGGFSVTLNLALAMVVVSTVRLFLGPQLGAWCLAMMVLADLLGACLRIGGVFPDRSAVPDYVLDDSLRALGSVGWRAVVLGAMYVLTSAVARRFRAAELALRERNAELERRLAAQAPLLEDRSPRSPASPEAMAATMTAPAASEDHTVPARHPGAGALLGEPTPPVVDVGSRVGRYELVDRLGAGAMGVVFEARDTELDRRVAVKLVSPRSGDAETARSRLRREAQAMARLSHPNVAAVFDIGTVGEQLFIAMELVRGRTLRAFVDEVRPWKETLPMLLAAARGLAAAHAAGVVHRDFKPDNVLVREDGAVRVSDFGLAREANGRVDATGSGDVPLELVTATGAIVGTPAYLAPESARGEADAASDQFAFAVTAFEVLEGKRPFESIHIVEMLRGDRTELPIRPWRRRDLPGGLRAAIERGLAMDPAARWPSMAALSAQLERILERPVRMRRAAMGVVAVAVIGGLWFATRGPTNAAPLPTPASTVAVRPWVERTLTDRGDVFSAALSPDGGQVAAHSGGKVVLVPVAHGEARFIDLGFPINLPRDEASNISWSPDSTRVLVWFHDGRQRRNFEIEAATGAVTAVDDVIGIPVLLGDGEMAAFTVNRRELVFRSVHGRDRPARSCAVPGDYQFIDDLQSTRTSVYVTVVWADQTRALMKTDRACSSMRVAVTRSNVSSFILAEDDRIFSFRTGDGPEVLTAHDRDGRPSGDALPLPPGTHAVAGVRADGAVVLTRRTVSWRLVDLASAHAVQRGKDEIVMALAPDRRRFAIIERRARRPAALYVVDRDHLEVRRGPLAEGVVVVAWSPDGTALAAVVPSGSGHELVTMAPDTGERRSLGVVDVATDIDAGVVWLDDRRVAFARNDQRTYRWIDRVDGSTGETLDPSLGWVVKLARSPKDGTLALFWNRSNALKIDLATWIIPLDKAPVRIRSVTAQDGHAWAPDGRLWLGERGRIDRYDPRTGEITHVRTLDLAPTESIVGMFPGDLDELQLQVQKSTTDLVLYAPP